MGGAGPTTRPQFPSGEEKSSNGFPSSGQEVSTSQQFPSSRPSGTEQHSPSGYPQSGRPQGIIPIHTQGPQYPSNGGEFSGEGRPIGQLPFGQTDRPVLEGTPSGGVTQPSDVTGGQQSPIRPGKPETGSQFPSNGFPKTGHSERPGFPGRPTGQAINGYPTIKEQPQGSNILSGTGRPQLPPQTPGISQSRTRPQNGQRPLSSYLPPGEQGTGNLPLSEVPAPQYPSVGPSGVPSPSQFPSRGAEEPSRSQNGFGDSTKPVGEVFSGGRPSGPRTSSGFPEQATSSQNGYESSGPSGFPGQPSRPQNGYSAPGASNGKTSNGRPFGPQIPSGERQTPSRPQQGINGYPSSGSSTPQQFSRPGAPDRSTTGSSQTFPGSQQGPRGFLPNQQRSDEENGFELEDEGDYSAIPGEPGRDYPILSDVPETSFSCDAQEYRGYYADVEARCQIFHICANNKTYDFICPNGTIFHQENLVCVWWNQFDCDIAPSLYRINENIYDFSVFGAQQTGGIPAPGQDYPDLSHGPLDFQATGGDTRRPGGYSNGGPQIPTGSDEESQRPEGYPRKTPQAPTGPFSRDQEGKPQGSGSYQAPSNGVQGPGRYAFGRSQRPSEGYPTGGSQRPGNGIQRPGGYPSGPQGTIQPDTARYPNGKPEGAGEFTSGESPRTVNGVQGFRKPSTGYPSEGPEEPSNGKGYPSKRPTGQNGSQGVSTPGIDASPPGGYPGGRPQGFPLGPRDRPVGPGRQTPPKYGVPEGPIPQPQGPRASPSGSQGPSGRPSTPGFPSGPQTPVPSGPGSPFPGSPQPHTPTREYLPSL